MLDQDDLGPTVDTKDQTASSKTEMREIETSSAESTSYSAFSKSQKAVVVALVATAGFFSPFTAFVYFPALQSIATDFRVSIERMNLTVTVYLIVQGLVPSILGDMSDSIGRRPIYLLIFVIYCAASIFLALQRNYAVLLVLRMLQSAGSSGTIALGYGLISDIAAPHERGKYVGVSVVRFNTAPALGPVVGGLIADKAGWPWIFVFLAAFSGSLLVLLALFLDETARSIVGSGTTVPCGINKSIYQYLRYGKNAASTGRTRLRVPNIIPCLKLIFRKTTFPVLISNATFYMMYSVLQATLAPLVQRLYRLTALQASICYLSYGLAGAVSSYIIGLITDRDYRIVANQHNFSIDPRCGDDLLQFLIEKARLRSTWIYISLASTCVVGYGWALVTHTHLAVPLILQFVIGFCTVGVFNLSNTLIVDMNPASPVTASASVSITRCLIAAGGVAVIEVLLNGVDPGWTFTVVDALCWATLPVYWMVGIYGWG